MSKLVTINPNLIATFHDGARKTEQFDMHYHTVYEFYYLIDGDVDFLVEGTEYHMEPDSIMLFAPYVHHGIRVNSPENYRCFVMQFDTSLITEDYRSQLLEAFPNRSELEMKKIYYTNAQEYSLFPFCQTLVNCISQKNSFARKLRPIYLEALLAQLSLMYRRSHLSDTDYISSETISKVIDYIHAHLSEKITLTEISKYFYISENHLNRLFRKTVGTTVMDYVLHKRIEYAQRLFKKGFSATEVATKVGFNDYTAFYRAHKKITGYPPKMYVQ